MRRLSLIAVCLSALCEAGQSVTTPKSDTYKFESKVNVVLVPVLVRDAHGNAVGTLKKEDFQVFDKDKLQKLTGFTIQKRASAASSGAEDVQESAAPTPGAAPSPVVAPARFIVFLFDDLHLEAGDLILVQKASTKMLRDSLAENDMAAVISTSGKTNSGMTRDRAKLAESITSLREQHIYHLGRNCPDVSYYQAELIVNKNDKAALRAAVADALQCAGIDPRMATAAESLALSVARQTLALAEQGTRTTLGVIKLIANKMAALPGQHTLILVSPGFLSLTPEAIAEKSEILDAAAQANVSVSALDARGLYTIMPDIADWGMPNEAKLEYHKKSIEADEDVMAELADGTGGTYFHNSNDLGAGFRKLTQAPEYLYLLEFTPQDVKQDGSYHRLRVKVAEDGLKLRARRGYFAPNLSKKKS